MIFAYLTCTRVRWEDGDECPIDEHGWIDRSWSMYVLHDARNDVSPLFLVDANDESLEDEVRGALGLLEGGFEDNRDGTFYSADSYCPFHDNPEGWDYSYAVHFKRKRKAYTDRGWVETPWHPVRDGGLTIA